MVGLSGVSRRGFLQALVAATAAAAALELDPERALWRPGERTFFLPDAPAPKQILSGDSAVLEMNRLLTERPEDFARTIKGTHRVSTSVGQAEFDNEWNLLKLDGRPITNAREAARLQAKHYTAFGNGGHGARFEDLVDQVAAKRAAAGLRDEVDERTLSRDRQLLTLLGA